MLIIGVIKGKKEKMHKIDLIFILGIIIINFLRGIGVGIYQKGKSTVFPLITIYGILASYVLWIVLLIYSVVTCKENKPRYV